MRSNKRLGDVKPNILITMGDPSGIGPEVTLKALASSRISKLANFFEIGDRFVVGRTEKVCHCKLNAPLIDLGNVPPRTFTFGKSKDIFGKAAVEYIDTALKLLREGAADAL
ncbi:MAG: hypothetical protein Q8Q87_00860, partial [Candidatus Omnitrophota bacterium]|nr:hypothetical protein [Candidatus Omnitrophota bacterium]